MVLLVVGGLIATPASATIQVLCKGISTADVKACNPGYAPEMSKMHWRMYSGHNCTNYVAYQLGVNGVPEPKILMGNAISWGANAKKLGYVVDSTPTVGSVGAWPGKKNHVTYVAEVGDGYIITHEDNYPGYYPRGIYQELKIYKGDSSYPTSFIHFKDLISGVKPTVVGTAQVGKSLTGTVGTWKPSGVTLASHWLRDGVAISGATDTTYDVVAADEGHSLSLQVTGSKSGLSPTKMTSAATADVKPGTVTNSVAPKIGGTTSVGSTLTVSEGTWQPSGTGFGYQWLRDGIAVPTETGSTYDLTVADLGTSISVEVTGTEDGYTSLKKAAAATGPIASGTITNSAQPTIAGEPKTGAVLTAKDGTWAPSGTVVSRKWLADGVTIAGATGTTYVPVAADIGKKISLKVKGTDPGYTTTSVASDPTVPVADGTPVLTNSKAPTITGDPHKGMTVKAKPGTWAPTGVTFKYQWFRAGTKVAGATQNVYKLTADDLGQTIVVKVTGTKTGFKKLVKSSKATAKITKPIITASTAPVIKGKATVGTSLKISQGTWSPSPVTLAYKWYRAGKAIKGATHTTYKLASADRGAAITVKVTGTKSGYPTLAKTSKATAKVK